MLRWVVTTSQMLNLLLKKRKRESLEKVKKARKKKRKKMKKKKSRKRMRLRKITRSNWRYLKLKRPNQRKNSNIWKLS